MTSRQVPGFTIAEVIYPAGVRAPAHMHDEPGFAMVLSGGYAKRVQRRSHDCVPGVLTFEPPGVVHAERYGRAAVRVVLVELISDERRAIATAPLHLSEPLCAMHSAVRMLGERASRELQAGDSASSLVLESVALELTALAARLVDAAPSRPVWLERVTERIRGEFRVNLSIQMLADQVGVHPAHLARVFRAHERCSVGEYLRRCRVEWAAGQLLTGDCSLAAVAHAAGFYDQSHFCRTFIRIIGTTPSRYRECGRRARRAK